MRASSPMGRKFVIADPATCIGCKTCMAACFHRHDVPNDVAVPRLTLVTTRTISAPVGCHHCAEAPCVDACPTGCLFTDDEHVGVHPDKCIGCRNCVLACPYGAVEIVTEKLPPEPEAASGTEAAAASAQDDKGARARARATCASIAPAARRARRRVPPRRCGSSMRSSWSARGRTSARRRRERPRRSPA